MLARRQPKLTPAVVVTFTACIITIAAVMFAGRTLTLAWSQRTLDSAANRATTRLDQYFSAAETSLRALEDSTRSLSPAQAAPLLAKAIYRTPLFREAGLINFSGTLTVTSMGPVDPPFAVEPGTRAPENWPPGVLHITGVVTTQVMNLPSLILSFKSTDGRELNFLMDPQLLNSALEGEVMNEGVMARFTSAAGVELIAIGANSLSEKDAARAIVSKSVSERFGTRIELRAPRAWALSGYNQVVLVLAPIALIGAGIVTLLVGLLTRRHRGLDYEIRQGIAADEFEAHYQPTIEIATGACIGAEVLMRWKHPNGYIRPDLFVAAAETSGLIDTLTLAQMKRVIREMKDVVQRYPGLHLGINLTAEHLSRASTPALLTSLFTQETIPPRCILLEATERQAMEGSEPKKVMSALRAAGFDIALDDFGTGYSSLAYLSEFKFQYLKIDASFIRRIGNDSVNTNVLDAIIEMGRALGVRLIAEGVETRAQALFLHRKGVQYAQGWLYAKAMSPEDFSDFLSRPPTPLDRLAGDYTPT